MVEETARALGVKKEHVLITSTGSINHFLPLQKIVAAIPNVAAKLSRSGGHAVARAIMTTDLRSKEIAIKVDGYTVAGVAKGSGMIHPNMATMNAFITTDAVIDRRSLQKLLKKAVDNSFNLVTVDQCQSTNDCVFVLANGLSGKKIRGAKALKKFARGLEEVCIHLAKEIARDGEGATQLIEVRVSGAKNEAEAKLVAREIACSDLLKCAVYGRDRNLGRVLGAAGATKAKLDPDKMKADIKFYKDWALVTCDLGVGRGRGTAWGCDLTEDYVKINADYHT
jgi:glutamate N-acetyltransferase/amino-acid N-acetyltransferase